MKNDRPQMFPLSCTLSSLVVMTVLWFQSATCVKMEWNCCGSGQSVVRILFSLVMLYGQATTPYRLCFLLDPFCPILQINLQIIAEQVSSSLIPSQGPSSPSLLLNLSNLQLLLRYHSQSHKSRESTALARYYASTNRRQSAVGLKALTAFDKLSAKRAD
ncbi:hypothetical protein BDV28DRAFT_5001 [Aspergillus coremiiformis]|uniref:Secreted protein n=1 Tax=Aspergillus coremiiformis TaxID=138285 RepID=A0A5N6Z3M9_9EURO|nr:hypothetical protein BDV28DRAFT_5001 [Aspergillus coremiiformis]